MMKIWLLAVMIVLAFIAVDITVRIGWDRFIGSVGSLVDGQRHAEQVKPGAAQQRELAQQETARHGFQQQVRQAEFWQGQDDYSCNTLGVVGSFVTIATLRDRGVTLEEILTVSPKEQEILDASAFERERRTQDDRTIRMIYANPQLTPQQVASLYRDQCRMGLYGASDREAATAMRYQQSMRGEACRFAGAIAREIVHSRDEGTTAAEAVLLTKKFLAVRLFTITQAVAEYWTTMVFTIYAQPRLTAVQA
jgi:hypothetical protein